MGPGEPIVSAAQRHQPGGQQKAFGGRPPPERKYLNEAMDGLADMHGCRGVGLTQPEYKRLMNVVGACLPHKLWMLQEPQYIPPPGYGDFPCSDRKASSRGIQCGQRAGCSTGTYSTAPVASTRHTSTRLIVYTGHHMLITRTYTETHHSPRNNGRD